MWRNLCGCVAWVLLVCLGACFPPEAVRPLNPPTEVESAPSVEDLDGDGVEPDQCPQQPEDIDGFEDDDGCPELDNDGDEVEDRSDFCPNEPEDQDGIADKDGCPETNQDGDGLDDGLDRCPLVPGPLRASGCPWEDTDADCVPDHLDACPELAGQVASGGCVDAPLAWADWDRVRLGRSVVFEISKAVIKPRSFEVLEALAALLKANPQITLLEIQGHDPEDSNRYSIKLSERRARSVREFLLAQGVAPERLEARGYGESMPLVPVTGLSGRALKEARATNRRIDLVIRKYHGQPMADHLRAKFDCPEAPQ